MNRIDKLFATKGRDILSVFYPAGYPSIDDTLVVLRELQGNGVDMVEIGIPFSDPMADGPVIQQASTKALANGISLKKIFEQLEVLREDINIPVILMGYLNPIMQYGFQEFCRSCKRAGVDGMIIPDLPFKDYVSDYKAIADACDLRVIMLITPETSEERIRTIDSQTSGFVYMVSSASTTGAQKLFGDNKLAYFNRVNAMGLRNPRLVGFGVSNRDTFDAVCKNASGAIIGSHFVSLLTTEATVQNAVCKLLNSIK